MSATETVDAIVAELTRDEAKILAHYAAGEPLDLIPQNAEVKRAEVDRVVMEIANFNIPHARTIALAWQRKNKPAAPNAAPATVAATATRPDAIADLINRATTSDVPRLVRLADKVQDLVDQLEGQLREYERGKELRAEAEKLERRLAEIKQALTPKRSASAESASMASAPDSKAVRAWAAANGVDCPERGRVPAGVLAAYAEAGV
ncbi:histone-like nucleoid-structuring protein Lsr2 [Actinoplanes sp. NPDC049118]|uniref:Lsr2 family DNA-binding protein n=1 Tax=Actinoplanes sp. NPDC049118 TaxID=3155769 RepID=UPI0033DC3127